MYSVTVLNVELSKSIGNLSWSDDVNTLGAELSFGMAFQDITKSEKLIKAGSIVHVKKDGKKFFVGPAVDEKRNENTREFTCYDLAFYMNKSDTVIQFTKMRADDAIRKLLNKFSIRHNVASIPIQITKIYKAEVVSDIVKDILQIVEEQTGVKYLMEMRVNTLYIIKASDVRVNIDVKELKYISNPSFMISMKDMKNSILVTSNDEKITKVNAQAYNEANRKQYGLLQMVHTIDVEELPKAKNIANQLLKELCKLSIEGDFEVPGNIALRSGRLLNITLKKIGIIGTFLIKHTNHTVDNGIYKTQLTVEVV